MDMHKEKNIHNKVELRFYGLSRSGNHAIIQWIIRHMKGKVRFLNHCSASKNPYKFKHSYKQWYNGMEVHAAHNFNHLDYLIFSYENQKLPNTKTSYFKKYHDKFFGPSDKIVDILILRDPFNHFASVLKSGMNVTASYLFSFEELWIDYAFEFLNKTNYLGNNTLKINYNKWVKDNSYKISILQFLNLQQKSNSAVYNKIPKFGGGSSFDNLNYQDRADNMDVFSRW